MKVASSIAMPSDHGAKEARIELRMAAIDASDPLAGSVGLNPNGGQVAMVLEVIASTASQEVLLWSCTVVAARKLEAAAEGAESKLTALAQVYEDAGETILQALCRWIDAVYFHVPQMAERMRRMLTDDEKKR
jgi:hypothetical protein